MAAGLDAQRLDLVFQSRPDILQGIKAAADSPARVTLFNNIANFVHDQFQTNSEPAAKRRRVDDGPAANGAGPRKANGTDPSTEEVLLEIKEISVSVPQRKKFELCFTAKHLYARAPGTSGPAQGIVYPWDDIEYAFYLPVPGKAQVQHNYVLFPKGSCLAALKTTASDAPEPLVFTIPATAPKQGTIGGRDAAQADPYSDAYHTLFHWAIRTRLRAAGSSADIVSADPSKFHSAIPQSHRPKEKAVHVGAFRGSKDGFLFFLENGILWGFKKPLLFIPLERVAAFSYTSVLQRTFNIVVEVFTEGDNTEEVEFGMIDQADYQGIDESYVKRRRLQDGSMADARKAKLELAENKAVKKEGGEEPGEQVSALEEAQREDEQRLQDEEDEDEEDYDPGSEGESEGSGASSDEDDDEEEGDDDEEGDGDEEEEVEEGDDDAEGEGEGEPEDDRMKEEEEEEEEVDVKQEEHVGIAQAGLAAEDYDELSGVPYNGQHDEMEMDETFDVVG